MPAEAVDERWIVAEWLAHTAKALVRAKSGALPTLGNYSLRNLLVGDLVGYAERPGALVDWNEELERQEKIDGLAAKRPPQISFTQPRRQEKRAVLTKEAAELPPAPLALIKEPGAWNWSDIPSRGDLVVQQLLELAQRLPPPNSPPASYKGHNLRTAAAHRIRKKRATHD